MSPFASYRCRRSHSRPRSTASSSTSSRVARRHAGVSTRVVRRHRAHHPGGVPGSLRSPGGAEQPCDVDLGAAQEPRRGRQADPRVCFQLSAAARRQRHLLGPQIDAQALRRRLLHSGRSQTAWRSPRYSTTSSRCGRTATSSSPARADLPLCSRRPASIARRWRAAWVGPSSPGSSAPGSCATNAPTPSPIASSTEQRSVRSRWVRACLAADGAALAGRFHGLREGDWEPGGVLRLVACPTARRRLPQRRRRGRGEADRGMGAGRARAARLAPRRHPRRHGGEVESARLRRVWPSSRGKSRCSSSRIEHCHDRIDVAVGVGAGPAGARSSASPGGRGNCTVLVLSRPDSADRRAGEVLTPVIGPLLAQLCVWERFWKAGPAPRTPSGRPGAAPVGVVSKDFVAGPHGPAWRVIAPTSTPCCWRPRSRPVCRFRPVAIASSLSATAAGGG